jgi:protein gp37
MGDKSGIEWTDATWNPVAGCSIVSPGCSNCYAMKLAARLARMGGKGGAKYAGLTQRSAGGAVWTGDIRFDDGALLQPLRWVRPRRIFVNSMSDLFHEKLSDDAIDKVFAVMALAPQHTFQVLTKRAERMQRYIRAERERGPIAERLAELYVDGTNDFEVARKWPLTKERAIAAAHWPLPNVWLGVSAEDQRRADERRDRLAALAALGWTTFASYEPALSAVDWSGWGFLCWLISGGESGPGARPSHPDWHRAARDFCAANGIAYFFKQWGEWLPGTQYQEEHRRRDPGEVFSRYDARRWDGECFDYCDELEPSGREDVYRVGKKAAGRLLDGRTHDDFPAPRPDREDALTTTEGN